MSRKEAFCFHCNLKQDVPEITARLQSGANSHTLSTISGYVFPKATALDTSKSWLPVWVVTWRETGYLGNKAQPAHLSPIIPERDEKESAHRHRTESRIVPFQTRCEPDHQKPLFCQLFRQPTWQVACKAWGREVSYCLTHILDTDRKTQHNGGDSVSPWESWSPISPSPNLSRLLL